MNSSQVKPDSELKSCILEILAFRTWVHLGCSEEERVFAQEVEFDVKIGFKEEPPGTRTDRLEDTICYASLCDAIDVTARSHPYRLIEALGREVYDALRIKLGSRPVTLQIAVHKLRTPVESLRGGARFIYGDQFR